MALSEREFPGDSQEASPKKSSRVTETVFIPLETAAEELPADIASNPFD